MSGGVDSSTVAHLLAAEGHELVGVRFSLWSDPLAPPMAQLLPKKCCNPQTIFRANTVAKQLKIPLHHLDLAEEFKEQVVDPFLRDYAAGLTPNPCIGCNRTIKFGRLLRFADEMGCEAVATGHYARIAKRQRADGKTEFVLREATDASKDQSYFLYALDQAKLSRILFPLGDRLKSDVLPLARSMGIPLPEHYDESQDVCFYPEKQPKAFLQRHIPQAIRPGEIRTTEGAVVGMHKGLPLYTAGQRRGLGIGGLKVPLHVVRKEVKSNTLFVAPDGAPGESELEAIESNWMTEAPPEGTEMRVQARISSQGKKRWGTLVSSGDRFSFHFDSPVRGIAPGQSAVLYKEDEVFGGGVIAQKA